MGSGEWGVGCGFSCVHACDHMHVFVHMWHHFASSITSLLFLSFSILFSLLYFSLFIILVTHFVFPIYNIRIFFQIISIFFFCQREHTQPNLDCTDNDSGSFCLVWVRLLCCSSQETAPFVLLPLHVCALTTLVLVLFPSSISLSLRHTPLHL